MPLPLCPHRPPCPGCPRYGDPAPPDGAAPLFELARSAGLPEPAVHTGRPLGFRHRARLSVRGRAASPKIGLFQAGSHRIVATPRCPIHHPRINEVSAALREAIRETRTPPYADAPHAGQLRTLQVVVERSTQTSQVVLVGNDVSPAPLAPLAAALEQRLGDRLHSLWWNGNPERTNVLLGDRWHRWSGPEAVCEVIADARVFFPPGAFGQSHLELADEMVSCIHSWVPPGARVFELYAGCGSIGLGLLDRSREVAFNEVNPDGLRGLELGLAAAGSPARDRATLHPGPAGDVASRSRIGRFDVAIVDPPRRGLDRTLRNSLCDDPPDRLIYASCSIPSFLGDFEALAQAGYQLAALSTFVLVPYSEHLEIAALLRAP